MFSVITSLWNRCTSVHRSTQKSANRHSQLGVEHLEDRSIPSGTPFSADAHRSLTTPTGSWWYHGVTADFLSIAARANNARITDIEVEGTAPYRFSATMVQNTGDYGKGWWWYFGLTEQQVNGYARSNNARLVDVESYFTNGERRFAVAMVANTGADAKGWWWYYNASPTFVEQHLQANNSRLIDIDREENGNLTFISVPNSGSDARGWWWYYNVSPSFVGQKLNDNRARLTDIERQSNGNFTVLMEQSQGEHWWWWYGTNATDLGNLAGRTGSRITDVETYSINGQKRFVALMLNNSNALTTRAGVVLRNRTDNFSGEQVVNVGTYLKQVNGSVLANLQGSREFEPASSLKVLIHLHAMREVQAGRARLNEMITYFRPPTGDDPNQNPSQRNATWVSRTVTLQTALQMMMRQSHNGTTDAIQRRFGTANINATATNLGLTGVRIGSTGPFGSGVAGNFMRLDSASRLYELVARGQAGITNGSATRSDDNFLDTFYNLMNNGVTGAMANLIRSEAARRLGRPASDATVQRLANDFIANTREVSKGGSYTLAHPSATYNTFWREIRTEAGWMSLPFRSAGNIVARGFTFGMFVEGQLARRGTAGDATRASLNAALYDNVQVEMFRDQVRAALATW